MPWYCPGRPSVSSGLTLGLSGCRSLGEPPMIVDVSTAVVAEGKVQVALAEGREMPPGCIVDSEGQPTNDPAKYFAGGGLIPLGGWWLVTKVLGLDWPPPLSDRSA